MEAEPVASGMPKVNPPTAYGMLTGFVQLDQGDYVIQNGANSAVSYAFLFFPTRTTPQCIPIPWT